MAPLLHQVFFHVMLLGMQSVLDSIYHNKQKLRDLGWDNLLGKYREFLNLDNQITSQCIEIIGRFYESNKTSEKRISNLG